MERGYERSAYHAAYPFGSYDASVLSVMTALGMETGRTTRGGPQYAPPAGRQEARQLMGFPVGDGVTLAQSQGYVDACVRRDATCFLVFHNIVDEPSTRVDWPTRDFAALMAYIGARGLRTLTVDAWYQGLTDPRYASLPVRRDRRTARRRQGPERRSA